MRLNCKYLVKNSKIKIEVETVDFTCKENRALDMLGEPRLEFQKTYPGDFTISINRKIRHNFKVKLELDGTNDFSAANAAGKKFIEDLVEAADELMYNFMDKFDDEEFPRPIERIPVSNN